MAEIIGSFGALFIVVVYLALVACGICLPFMAWSVTRNIKQMRIQFERLNDSLDARASEGRSSMFGR